MGVIIGSAPFNRKMVQKTEQVIEDKQRMEDAVKKVEAVVGESLDAFAVPQLEDIVVPDAEKLAEIADVKGGDVKKKTVKRVKKAKK